MESGKEILTYYSMGSLTLKLLEKGHTHGDLAFESSASGRLEGWFSPVSFSTTFKAPSATAGIRPFCITKWSETRGNTA